jgi:hypothetical protein
MPSQGQNKICTLLKKIQMNVHRQFNIHILIFGNKNVNIIPFIKVIKVRRWVTVGQRKVKTDSPSN